MSPEGGGIDVKIEAQYQFVLAFSVTMRVDDIIAEIEFKYNGALVIIHPPRYSGKVLEWESRDLLGQPMEDRGGVVTRGGRDILQANRVFIDVVTEVDSPFSQEAAGVLNGIAINALRRFMKIYRFRAKAHWVDPNAIEGMAYKYIDKGGKIVNYVDDNGEWRPGVYIMQKGHLPQGVDNPITAQIWQQISTDIESDYEVFLAQSLILDAQDLLRLGRYRLAIVEAIIALEVGVSDFLQQQLGSGYNSHIPLRRKLEMTTQFLPHDAQELRVRCDAAREMRNNVVHEGDHIAENQRELVIEYVSAIDTMIGYFEYQAD